MPLASRPRRSGSRCSAAACRPGSPRMKPTCWTTLVDDQRRLQPGREGVELGDRPREGAGRPAELAVREIGPRDVADGRGRRRRSGRSARSDRRRRRAPPGRTPRHVGVADWRASSAAAMAAEKKVAVRAFCSDTSVPKIGASGERTMPSTAPLVSTTEIVTWARLSSGRRIWARAAAHDLEGFLEDGARPRRRSAAAPPASVPARIG